MKRYAGCPARYLIKPVYFNTKANCLKYGYLIEANISKNTRGFIMATKYNHISELIDKLETLPPERIAEVEDFVDFLRQKTKQNKTISSKKPLDFPVISVGKWPDDLSLNREDMYGDDGR